MVECPKSFAFMSLDAGLKITQLRYGTSDGGGRELGVLTDEKVRRQNPQNLHGTHTRITTGVSALFPHSTTSPVVE